MYKNQAFFRWGTSGAYDSNPRSDGAYANMFGRGGMTGRQYMEKTKGFIKELDPAFFGPLLDGEVRTPDHVQKIIKDIEDDLKKKGREGDKYFGEKTGSVSSVDDLYKAAGAYTAYLMQTNPGAATRMMEKVRAEHLASGAKAKMDEHMEDYKRQLEVAHTVTGVNPPGSSDPLWYVGHDVDISNNSQANNNWFFGGARKAA